MNAEELLGAARLTVRGRAPYFRAALIALVPREEPGMGTIAVSKSGVLMYDPLWIEKQKPATVAGLLVHELMHLLDKHAERLGARDPGRWNVACDRAINPSVVAMGFELPTGEDTGVFPKDIGAKDGLTADEYYALDQQQQQNKPKQGEGKGDEKDGEGAPGAPNGDKPKPGKTGAGKCGSCAGNAHEKEPAEGEADEGKTPAQMARIARQVAEAIKDHVKARGTVPAGLARWADAALEPPQVPWEQKLAKAVRSCVAYRAGAVVSRYDWPSRRQAGLGYGVGRPILPRHRSPVPNVVFVGDTSGSMSAADLSAVVRETAGVLKAVGAAVTFCACDAAVHALKKVSKAGDVAALLKGGGGSDFTPAFAEIAKLKPRPEVAILCTDGYIGVPPTPPPGLVVIWLVLGNGPKPAAWGEEVRIK